MPVGQGGGGGGRRATVRRQVDSVAELRTFHAPCRNLPAGTEASSRPRSCPPSTRSPSWTRRGHAPRCGRDARREISRDVPVHRRTVLEPASHRLRAAGVPQPLRQAVEGVRKVRGAYREGGRGQLRLLVQQPSATSTGGSCAFPELLYAPLLYRYSDYVHCVDTCGAKVLFATLR